MSDEQKKPEKPKQFNLALQLDEETAQGKYVNFAIVNHTLTEFVLDFIFVQPQQPRGKVLSRVVLSPVNAKRLLMALTDNLSRFEQRFGQIAVPAAPTTEPVVH